MLTIIENASNTWMIVTVDDALRVYARAEEGEWSELPQGEDPEQVDPEKSFMLEELYARKSEDEEKDGEQEFGSEDEEPDDEEELDEGEPELAEDEESDDGDDEAPQEEPKPRRRRAAAPKGGRSTARK